MMHVMLASLVLALSQGSDPAEEVRSVAPVMGRLPTVFIENLGQWDTDARFRATLPGQILQVQPDGLELGLVAEQGADCLRGARVDLTFEGAEEIVGVRGLEERLGRYNYFFGKDPRAWCSEVRSFSRVEIEGLYSGIDLRVHADRGAFEYDLQLEAGADLSQVVVHCEGIEDLAIDEAGSLCLRTAHGVLRQPPPKSWYTLASGERKSVEVHYHLLGEDRFGFALPTPREPLAMVVDPPIHWSTYLGGGFKPSAFEQINDLEVLSSGEVVVVGRNDDPWFPTTPGAFDRTFGGCDVFVTKLTADGSDLVFSTFLGGESGCDQPNGLAIGADGALFIAGDAASSDFPVTNNGFQSTFGGGSSDAFVTKMLPDGSDLVYSTYLGGESLDSGADIAVDDSQRAVVVGRTISVNFPTTADAFDRTFNDFSAPLPGDAFVAYLSSSGGSLSYSTYLGGDGDDAASSVVINSGRVANVVGATDAMDFPIRGLAWDATVGGAKDAFLARLDPALGQNALVLSTFYGEAGGDFAFSVALGPDSSIYILGETDSAVFPTSQTAYDRTFNGLTDLFVLHFDGAGERRLGATLIGGDELDETRGGQGLAVDGAGSPIIMGWTRSQDFPTTGGSYAPTFLGGLRDGIVARFSPDLDRLLYSTYFLGGEADEYLRTIQVDDEGVATVAGYMGGDMLVTEGAWDTRRHGIWDGFITRLSLGPVLKLNGQPKAGQSVSFTVENAFPAHIGNVAQVFLSCSGTSGIPVPGGLELPLSFDFCTAFSVRSPGLFSATIDASGQATTPSLPFPAVIPVGFTLHAAALTIDTTAPRFVSVTCPVEIVAE